MSFFQKIFNYIFKRNTKILVWHESATFIVHWSDFYEKEKGIFNYCIFYYPYRNNKYVLECTPKKLTFLLKTTVEYHQHKYYEEALNKLQEFQKEELINLIELPQIKGIK